ncbi:MAG: hypothetical protein MUE63_07315 [Xanthomonadales bacterium]|nr:hypothetical protein [Xanthomonadales bacterium]
MIHERPGRSLLEAPAAFQRFQVALDQPKVDLLPGAAQRLENEIQPRRQPAPVQHLVHQRAFAGILQHLAALQAVDETEGQLAGNDDGPHGLRRRVHQHLHARRTALRIAARLARDHLACFQPGAGRGLLCDCSRRRGRRTGNAADQQESDGQECN